MLLSSIADKTVKFNVYDVFMSNFPDAPQYLEFDNCDESLYQFSHLTPQRRQAPTMEVADSKQVLNHEFQNERFSAQEYVYNRLKDLAGSSCNVAGSFKLVGMYVMDMPNAAESEESQDAAIATVAELSAINTMKAVDNTSDAEVKNSINELIEDVEAFSESLQAPSKVGKVLTPLQIRGLKEGIRETANFIDELELMEQTPQVEKMLTEMRLDIAQMREKFRIGMCSTRLHMSMD